LQQFRDSSASVSKSMSPALILIPCYVNVLQKGIASCLMTLYSLKAHSGWKRWNGVSASPRPQYPCPGWRGRGGGKGAP
jgi:hypothetical protein